MKPVFEEIPTAIRSRFTAPSLISFLLGAVLASLVAIFVLKDRPIQEGVLYSVQWVDIQGNSNGRTRANVSAAVPGKTGSWGVKMRGRLYATHLEIEYLDRGNRLTEVIPFDRLVSVQFGDGGILDDEVVAQ
jgi:hypothetical protein